MGSNIPSEISDIALINSVVQDSSAINESFINIAFHNIVHPGTLLD